MKATFAACFLTFLGLTWSNTVLHPRGCIYIRGNCYKECAVGTHAFATGCGYVTPEATCENPHPVEDTRGAICDYSACYCDPPTVRDTTTKKCVKFEDCPHAESIKEVPH